MIHRIKKLVGLFLTAQAVALLVCPGIVVSAEQQGEKVVQPQSLAQSGVYALRQTEPNLTGTGVKLAVISRSITYIDGEPQNDYRPRVEHKCFAGKQFKFNDSNKMTAGVSPHSTAICSVLFGDAPRAFNQQLGEFVYQGAAPGAQGEVYEFWHFLINNVFPCSAPDADIITVGIGSQFEDWWTRGIESLAEHHGPIVVAGIGNGSAASDPVLYPAAAANVIGVGVVDSVNTNNPAINLSRFSLARPEHSSFGPTNDGRCKPDIVAPGNCLAADSNDPRRYEPTGNWSSFSTPTVAGSIGLLVQKAKEDPNLSAAVSPNGGNCVIKAIVMNSAKKLPYWHKGKLSKDDDHSVPLDYLQGAGMLDAVGAYEQLVAGANKVSNVSTRGWDLNQLDDETPASIYGISIAEPADKFITVTAVWNKHYSSVYPFESVPEENSDLRLELWAVDLKDPNNCRLLDYSDSRVDNVEHIYVAADANYTDYEIVILYSDIEQMNSFATQRYGLAWNVGKGQDSDSIFWYDLNADGIVDALDLNVLVDNLVAYINGSENYLIGDINSDGVIDADDLQILMEHQNLKAQWYKQ